MYHLSIMLSLNLEKTHLATVAQVTTSTGDIYRGLEQQWAIENDVDIFVNRITEDQLPQAVTLEMLKTATAKDPVLQQLKDDITKTKF